MALTLFQLKVMPMTYGLDIIWEHLMKRNLEDIERVKATFLKRALCLSKTTPFRLVYVLARQSFYIEDLRHQLLLPSTEAYNLLIREREEKAREIWPDFYATDAMLYRDWTRAGYDLRHIVTRMAVHGFHHLLCKTETYHQPTDQCVCMLRERACDRYHVLVCVKRKVPNYAHFAIFSLLFKTWLLSSS